MTYTNQYKTCHECGHTGHRNGDEFRPAVTIADRHSPWDESIPVKSAGDDILRDRSACDSAATPPEQSPPRQMTPGAVGLEPTAGR